MAPTVADLQADLKAAGIAIPKGARKADLLALAADVPPAPTHTVTVPPGTVVVVVPPDGPTVELDGTIDVGAELAGTLDGIDGIEVAARR